MAYVDQQQLNEIAERIHSYYLDRDVSTVTMYHLEYALPGNVTQQIMVTMSLTAPTVVAETGHRPLMLRAGMGLLEPSSLPPLGEWDTWAALAKALEPERQLTRRTRRAVEAWRDDRIAEIESEIDGLTTLEHQQLMDVFEDTVEFLLDGGSAQEVVNSDEWARLNRGAVVELVSEIDEDDLIEYDPDFLAGCMMLHRAANDLEPVCSTGETSGRTPSTAAPLAQPDRAANF